MSLPVSSLGGVWKKVNILKVYFTLVNKFRCVDVLDQYESDLYDEVPTLRREDEYRT